MLDDVVSRELPSPLSKRQRETRQRILNETLRMIGEDGLDKVSWRAIARTVNYSPAGLYEYFENKDHIVATLAEEGLLRLATALREVDAALPLEDRLVAMGQAYIDYAKRQPDYYSLVFTVLPSKRRAPEEPSSGPYRLVLDVMQQGITDGVFRAGVGFDADAMAYSFWSLVHGMASLQLSNLKGYKADFAQVDQEGMRRLVTGLKG